jgi:pimeloyl-ACP methyl ester carboxylesterase
MATITAGQENNTDIEIYYEDHGADPHALLEHLDVRDAVLAGHPMGAP